MTHARRSGIGVGVALIVVGALFLVGQFVPGLWGWVTPGSWPLLVIGAGVFLLLLGLIIGAPGMAVPACIVGGIGGLLYWQNATGNWESWAYAWALIPCFVGIGIMLAELLEGKFRTALVAGGWPILVGLIMFAIFGSFLGGPAVLQQYARYWPVLLILLGVLSLTQVFRRQPR